MALPRPQAELLVVVVDDAEVSRRILLRLLTQLPGVVCKGFGVSDEALAWCLENEPDLVIVDYRMPRMDGIEFIARLRASQQTSDVPIVMLTNEQDRTVAQSALERGATDLITKPADPAEFSARVRNLLTMRRSQRALAERMLDMRASLNAEQQRSERHLKRLEALWRVSVEADMNEEHRFHEILEEGALSFGASQHFCGTLFRVEGEHLVAEYVATRSFDAANIPSARPPVAVGTVVPISNTIAKLLPAGRAARWWDDFAADEATAEVPFVRQRGWRCGIGTYFTAGDRRYVLTFLSQIPIQRAFDEADGAYVELLSSFFALKFQEREHERRLRYQAEHDGLTGLINRGELRRRLDTMIASSLQRPAFVAVVLIDIDRFKEINDTLGHLKGDEVLMEAARRLEGSVRERDSVARIGGDEFGILLTHATGPRDVELVCRRIANDIAEPLDLGTEVVHASASMGVALFPADGATTDDVLARADAALYRAKQSGRGRFEFFSAEIDADLQRRRTLSEAIHRALVWDEFELYVQPEIDLGTMQVIGAEALIRWNHPSGGLMPPAAFIPFAEENGLINRLGAWVMRRALKMASDLRAIRPSLRLYFNLSASQLHDPGFAEQVADRVKRMGLAPSNIGVEITESAAMRNPRSTIDALKMLRSLGMSVALDDFGTGYSSLAYMKQLPVDVIKIDQTFVSGLPGDADDAAIVEAVISFGRKLGRIVLAEGVETAAQLEWLRERGCDRAQGFFIAKPMPLGEFVEWLRSQDVGLTPSSGQNP